MENATLNDMMVLKDGNVVLIGGKKFTVSIPADYPDQTWLMGARGGRNFLRGYINVDGLMSVVSWQSGQPLVDKFLQQLKVIQVGDMLEDVTGMKVKM